MNGEGAVPVPRCQYVSPSPWGPSQCALPDGHSERHAYDPGEHLGDAPDAEAGQL